MLSPAVQSRTVVLALAMRDRQMRGSGGLAGGGKCAYLRQQNDPTHFLVKQLPPGAGQAATAKMAAE